MKREGSAGLIVVEFIDFYLPKNTRPLISIVSDSHFITTLDITSGHVQNKLLTWKLKRFPFIPEKFPFFSGLFPVFSGKNGIFQV